MAEEGGSSYSKVSLYSVKDDAVQRARRTCPECGPGVFLAKHKDREHCGRCGHTEFSKKPEDGGKKEQAAASDKGDE